MSEFDDTAWHFRRHQDIAFEIFKRKHAQYGPNNIAVIGMDGIVSRMHDKIARMQNLAVDTADDGDSVADAHYDMANYAIIRQMVYEGQWPQTNIAESADDILSDVAKECWLVIPEDIRLRIISYNTAKNNANTH